MEAEKAIADNLDAEVNRATGKENELNTAITDESARAKAEEKVITDALNAEVKRSTDEDAAIKASIDDITADATALS